VVVPTALALQRADDAAQLLEAVAVGYAIAGSLTDGMTPRASEAGWRLAALTAPVTAASVAAVVLDLDDDDAVSALRGRCMGGELRNAGRGRLAPPWTVRAAGVYAARRRRACGAPSVRSNQQRRCRSHGTPGRPTPAIA
jgi:2-methylcitrate dehydratase PrpD